MTPTTRNQLTQKEAELFAALQERIRLGFAAFMEVGTALIEISDKRLYREQHSTFEEYCQKEWNMTARHAYRLCEAAEVVKALPENATKLVTTEAQARALKKSKPEKRANVLETACERAESEGRPLTAAHIRTAVEELNEPNGGEPTEPNPDRPEPTPSACPRLPDLAQVKNDIAAAISDIEAFETGAEDFNLDNCADAANALRDAAKALLKAQREF